MINQKQPHNRFVLITSVIFIIWSAIFLYRVSFIGIDGKRYFNLFDDSMISMRYAWNLSHGMGLVWNLGEYIEGYTNLLMTLFMALVMLIFDDKRISVFVIHLSGIVFMLGNAYTMMLIAKEITLENLEWHRKWLARLTFISVLFYYPLAYWSLMGMETGLVTLLIMLGLLLALRYVSNPGRSRLILIAIFLGLAYLARPDAFIAAILIFIYLFYETYQAQNRTHLLYIASVFGLFALFIMGQQIFRWNYYGELVPNTYTLKATGMPFFISIRNGVGYIIPFLQTTIIAIFFMSISLILRRQKQKLLLVYIVIGYLYYQIWVGGDAFPPYWRVIAPATIVILMLAIDGILSLIEFLPKTPFFKRYFSQSAKHSPHPTATIALLFLTFAILIMANIDFLPEITLLSRPYEAKSNEYHVNTAIALNNLTTDEAIIGVSSAGTVPYYSDRVAIDFLGKTDKYIAQLPPDLSGAAQYHGMLSLPGHNKYDLNYSIKTLQPTYVQTASWGRHVLYDWVESRYAQVEYKGVQLYLLKDSAAVRWDKIDQLD